MKIPAALIIIYLLIISCNSREETTPVTITDKQDTSTRVAAERSINPYAGIDVSPMDMAYFPREYPKLKMSNELETPPYARIIYSRPHLQGRSLFRDLLKYEEPWRLGANEATELELYKDATIQGKKIKTGRYILYSIPHQEQWTIVINRNVDTWGLRQDTTQDVARFNIPITKSQRRIEYYTMIFENMEGGANLVMAWDSFEARLPINF